VWEIYPIRKSNKPPYIYWRVLVIIGVVLLLAALAVTPFATYTAYVLEYSESGDLLVRNLSFRIPQRYPISLIISFKKYITNLRVNISCGSCPNLTGSVKALTHQKTYRLPCGRAVDLRIPDVEVFLISLNGNPKCSGNLELTYSYMVYEVENPYSFLTYVGLFLSLGGASAGVLGVVLMIKKKVLEKAEEKYLK